MDRKTLDCWTGHEHLYIVDNSCAFEEKIRRAVARISKLVGMPVRANMDIYILLSICIYLYLSVYLSMYLIRSIHLYTHPSMYLFVAVYLCMYRYIYLIVSIHPSIRPSIYLYLSISIYLSNNSCAFEEKIRRAVARISKLVGMPVRVYIYIYTYT